MRLLIHCAECSRTAGKRVPLDVADLRNDSIYEGRCPEGHRSFTIMQTPKWELLFDAGALALRDSYLRESVASFTAALEEFWSFYVRVI